MKKSKKEVFFVIFLTFVLLSNLNEAIALKELDNFLNKSCEKEVFYTLFEEIFKKNIENVFFFSENYRKGCEFLLFKVEKNEIYLIEGFDFKEYDSYIGIIYLQADENELKKLENVKNKTEANNLFEEIFKNEKNFPKRIKTSEEKLIQEYKNKINLDIFEKNFSKKENEIGYFYEYKLFKGNYSENYKSIIYKKINFLGFEYSKNKKKYFGTERLIKEIEDLYVNNKKNISFLFNLKDHFSKEVSINNTKIIDLYDFELLFNKSFLDLWGVDKEFNIYYRASKEIKGAFITQIVITDNFGNEDKTNYFNIIIDQNKTSPKLKRVFQEEDIKSKECKKYYLFDYFDGENLTYEILFGQGLNIRIEKEILEVCLKNRFNKNFFYIIAKNPYGEKAYSNKIEFFLTNEANEKNETSTKITKKYNKKTDYFKDSNFLIAFLLSITLILISIFLLLYFFLPNQYRKEKKNIEYYENFEKSQI